MDAHAVDQLLDCHLRIRSCVALARRLPEVVGMSAETIAEAAASVAGFFSVTLPLHARDEELAARLLLERAGVSDAVRGQLAQMAREHRDLHGLLDEAVPLWREVALSPSLLRRQGRVLGRLAGELEARFAAHLVPEEGIVFPAFRALAWGESRATTCGARP
jgi:hypothetical protein